MNLDQIEIIIGGESLIIDDINLEIIDKVLKYQLLPPENMYYINISNGKYTVNQIRQKIAHELVELIPEKITQFLAENQEIIENANQICMINEFTSNPLIYQEYYYSLGLLDNALNPSYDMIKSYFPNFKNQTTYKSRLLCNLINVYLIRIEVWRQILYNYRCQKMAGYDVYFNSNVVKYELSSLIELIINEL
jgi:hypothetical protein